MSAVPFEYGEAELAQALGVATKHFQRQRVKNLRQGVEWELVNLRVAYAKNGAARILELVAPTAITAPELALLLEKSRLKSGEKNGGEIEAVVCRFYLNPRLMQVTLPNAAKVNVRVKETKNFRVGMEVPVRPLDNGGYELARKLPRFAGRW